MSQVCFYTGLRDEEFREVLAELIGLIQMVVWEAEIVNISEMRSNARSDPAKYRHGRQD